MTSQKEKILEFRLERDENIFGFCIKGGEDKPIGIYISEVEKFSIADIAGLKVFDLILSVNDFDFTKLRIQEAIHILSIVKSAKIVVKRNPSFRHRKPMLRSEATKYVYEMISIFRPDLRIRFGFTINFVMEQNQKNKFIVTSIKADSLAGLTNLKVGDEIIVINNKRVETLDDFYLTLKIFKTAMELKMIIKRSLWRGSTSQIRSVKNKKASKKSKSINNLQNFIDQLSEMETLAPRYSTKKKVPKLHDKINKSLSNFGKYRSKSAHNKCSCQMLATVPRSNCSCELNEHIYDNNFTFKTQKPSKSFDDLIWEKDISALSSVNPSLKSCNCLDDKTSTLKNQYFNKDFYSSKLKKITSDFSFSRFEKSKGKDTIKNYLIDKKSTYKHDDGSSVTTCLNCKSETSRRISISSEIVTQNGYECENDFAETYCMLPISIELKTQYENSINIESESIIPENPLELIKNDKELSSNEIECVEKSQKIYESYKSKLLSNGFEYTPDGLILINYNKQHEKLGLRFCLDESSHVFKIVGFDDEFKAQQPDLIQAGMILLKINDIELSEIKTVQELEQMIENMSMSNNNHLQMLIRPECNR